jgi:hypothetical protein
MNCRAELNNNNQDFYFINPLIKVKNFYTQKNNAYIKSMQRAFEYFLITRGNKEQLSYKVIKVN